MRDFIGREAYLQKLRSLWGSGGSRAVAVYGRRRVGKTALLERFSEGKKAFLFEAIEGEDTAAQVRHFLAQLAGKVGQPHLKDLNYKDWPSVFDLLTRFMEKEGELVLVFDELSWMAAGRSRLVATLKYYWDRHWKKHPHLLMILCGSVASWMVKNVVRSQALYGRLSETHLVEPLKPFEVAEFIGKKRGLIEILEYLLCFGGIPRYLEEFDFSRSLELNIERTCFQPSGFFRDEADKIFYNQFHETHVYRRIVEVLLKGPLSLQGLSEKLSLPSGGGFKTYLDNLVSAGIVDKMAEIRRFHVGRTSAYHMMDEFLRFDHLFIRPNRPAIEQAAGGSRFARFTRDRWAPFLGLAFERFCLKYRYAIAEILEFGDKVIGCGGAADRASGGYQYDLIYLRSDDVMSLCEVKYLSEPPSTSLIRQMEEKIKRTPFPRDVTVERILISNREASDALRESGYFHRILTAQEIVGFKF